MSEAGTLERLLLVLGDALSDFADTLDPGAFEMYIYELGLTLPAGVIAGPVLPALTSAKTKVGEISPALNALRPLVEAPGEGDAPALIAAGTELASKIAASAIAFADLATALKQSAAGIADPATRSLVEDFCTQLVSRIFSRLLLDHLDSYNPRAAPMLAMLGLADDRMNLGDGFVPPQEPFYERRIHFDRFAKILTDPKKHFADHFGWGTPSFDAVPWLKLFKIWFDTGPRTASWSGDSALNPPPEPSLSLGLVRLQTDRSASPPGLAAELLYSLAEDIERETELGGTWVSYLSSSARFEGGLRAAIAADGKLKVSASGSPVIKGRAGLRWTSASGEPARIVGLAGGSYLQGKEIDLSVGLEGAGLAPSVQLKMEDLSCVLDAGGGDGFLKSISGGGRSRSEVSLTANWSPATGLKFTGSAGLEIAIPVHARLGPATLETVHLVGTLSPEKIILEISGSIRGELGPFKAVVERVGAELTATFPPGGGNLGPVDLDVGFKPPTGLGLSIDGGGFSGGGFMRRDVANGEYGGALELSFQEVIDVKAFGVLNTRLPDGSDGFSLAVVISAEFAPIQLSFGFTLLGVGGLLGVNRTALYDQLRLGLRDGSMDSLLFPKNLVANAPRIINDLKRMFPPQEGRFLIGPMAKLGWGTPSIITLDIGLLLEIPRPGFAILGILRMALPAKEAAILDLQVNFLGVVDFERKELSFDASLFDSRLLAFTLTGDMALRIYWGDNPNFLMSVGGFHPDYVPPPLALPTLNRLAISMWAGNPRLTAEAYFAVTSNTVQFGAKVELYYGVKVFNVYGFISLDALIQFEPFYLIAKVAGQVAVRSGGSTLFAIRLEMTLEGPSPWHAHGSGSFEIGFVITVTISAGFDVTFGEKRTTSLPPVQLRTLIEDALRNDGSWRVLAAGRQHVATRDLTDYPHLVVSPLGALAVAQKAAPLNLALARVGARRVEGANKFGIVDVSLGAGTDPPATTIALEQFAAAQYLDLSDAERLSRRSFEPLEAGVEIASGLAPRAGVQTKVDVAYEVIYVRKPRRRLLFKLRDGLFDFLHQSSAAARSKLGRGKKVATGVGTPKVTLPTEQFVVAGVSDLQPVGSGYSSQTAAFAALKEAVANDPSLSGRLQVVSAFEAAA